MGFKMEMNFEGNLSIESFIDMFDTLSEAKVFNQIIILCDKEDMKYYSNKVNRAAISKRTGLSEITVKNCMVTLLSKNLLIKLSKGVYRLNPKYISLHNKKYINK